ncbi:hypothetical protein F5888DRAFT_1701989 [Russula emetica]|nr:hypothetical protein F5888DRAFT_1701989 [Russula emetica]
MGSASSKLARTSATKSGKKPSWSGASIPPHGTKSSPGARAQQPWASEFKDEEIQRDAKDPQLLANLSRLKPVDVHHHKLSTGTKDHVRELFESRARAEDDAISARTPHNRLHVSSLVELLKERKDMVVDDSGGSSTTATTKQLAKKYGVDVELLEKLVRYVNVPSEHEMPPLGDAGAGAGAGAGSVRYVKDAEGGEDIAVREVEWREPTHTAT